jgi:hypothetical protein
VVRWSMVAAAAVATPRHNNKRDFVLALAQAPRFSQTNIMISRSYFNGSAYCCLVLFLLMSSQPCSTFSIMPLSKNTVTREAFLNDGLVVLIGSTSGLMLPGVASRANAAMTGANQISYSAALRNVKSVQKKFGALELYVVEDEYGSLREAIRVAPFSEVRKSCTTLVRASSEDVEGGGEAVSPVGEALAARYKTFIANFEKMDGTASLAMRGKKLKEGEFYGTYQATVAALDDFLLLAQERNPSTEIPPVTVQ